VRADWLTGNYWHSTDYMTLAPTNDTEVRYVGVTDNSLSAWTNAEGASAHGGITTYRNFYWSGPGWPTSAAVHFQAIVSGSATGNGSAATSAIAEGVSDQETTLNGNYSSEVLNFPNHVITGYGFTGQMKLMIASDNYSASASIIGYIAIP
jgi:hypothetical protein